MSVTELRRDKLYTRSKDLESQGLTMIRSTAAVVVATAALTTPFASAATSTGTHVNESVVASASAASVPNRFATAFPTVQSGSNPANIKALAYLLLGNGVYSPVTTTYTSAVANGVKTYQSKHGLPATGVATPQTLAALSTQLTSGTTSARAQALAVLLSKQGYPTALSTGTVKNLDASTMSSVHAFQAGHGIAQSSYVGNHTWATLFADKSSGPLFPQMQAGTGAAQWNNCGPASFVTVELNKGVTPNGWNGNPLSNSAAVNYVRYSLIKVPNTAYNNAHVGTVPANIIPAFAKVGISSRSGSTASVMAAARAGHPSIAGGDAYQLPWNRLASSHVRGPASHFIAVLGWDGTHYLVIDPIAMPAQNIVHLLTPAQLTNFGATAPGWGPNVPGNNVPPSQNNIITN